MQSAIYAGQVRHRRMRPVRHDFSYPLFMMFLDLAELDTVFAGRWFWSTKRPAPARFDRSDHLGNPDQPLDEAVRDLVESETGRRPLGPIRLLTHLRYFGYCFNPVSFFYCHAATGERLEFIVAEVNNTPWGERTCYVLDVQASAGQHGLHGFAPLKRMHVSPFMEMDVNYDWRLSEPGDRLAVHMESHRSGAKLFDATLELGRREIGAASLARVLLGYPLITLKVILAIHWQALKLWLKGAPVHAHPAKHAQLER